MGENYSQNFKYLDELIHRGFKELTLDTDIILDADEKVIYYNGINLECDDIIIDGNYHTIDAKHNARIFNIKGKNITIKNITLINAHCDEGGAIYNNKYSNLTLFNVTFINNISTEDGGAIVNFGEISSSYSNFLKNNARCGGAIFNQDGAILNFIFSDFKENTAIESGGAIKNNGTVNLENCDFRSHSSMSDGGVIFNQDFGVLKIMKNNFNENSSKYHGGVLTNWGKIIIENSEFNNNCSINSGGVIHNQKGSITIIRSKFHENKTTKKHGGAIHNYGKIEIENSDFIKNSSKMNGGAVNIQKDSIVEITNTEFRDNLCENNGGALNNNGTMNLIDCKITSNTSKKSGGAINNRHDGILNLIDSELEDNLCENNGGALNNNGTMNLIDCKITSNTSKKNGGAINNQSNSILNINRTEFKENIGCFNGALNNWGRIEIDNCKFTYNSAEKGFGGAIRNFQGSESIISETLFINNQAGIGASISNESEDAKFINSQFLEHRTNGNNTIFNKNYLKLINCEFKDNSTKFIIINEIDSWIELSDGKLVNNNCKYTIYNKGKYCGINRTKFENNKFKKKYCENILNEGNLSLIEPKFKTVYKTIINKGHVDVRRLSHEQIERIIQNEGTIDEFNIPQEFKSDFSYLDYLIHKNKEVHLKDNVTLENYEWDYFEGGIEIDVDNFIMDGEGKTIDAKSKTRIFLISGKNITLKNIIFKNGHLFTNFDEHISGGGAIRIVKGSNLNLIDCKFINNYSDDDGGSILNNGSLKSENNRFMQNRSHYNGGAIHNNFKLTVFNDEYSSNKAKIAGAIYNKDCLKIMGDVTFSNNISDFIEPVYNANLITSKRNLEGNVHDTGFINVEKGSAESFTDLKNKIKKSNEIILKENIIFDNESDHDLKSIDICNDLIIDGNGHLIDGKYKDISFNINAKVIFKNLIFKNCFSKSKSFIENSCEAIFKNCKFLNNKSKTYPLIKNLQNLNIIDSFIMNNILKDESLIKNEGHMEVINTNFTNNYAYSYGCVLDNYCDNEKALIKDSTFKNNYSKKEGGAIFNRNDSILEIVNSKFMNNDSNISGGAIFNLGELYVLDCDFIINTAKMNGGAIANVSGVLELESSKFNENHTNKLGGALFNFGKLDIFDCEFKKNTGNIGGAINNQEGNLKVIDNIFEENSAKKGGAIRNYNNKEMKLENCNFKNNKPDNVK